MQVSAEYYEYVLCGDCETELNTVWSTAHVHLQKGLSIKHCFAS